MVSWSCLLRALPASAPVGYQSEAAFQRAFKQRMGVTPAQWRRGEHLSD
jgi:AraC-like DNA-binding protein